MENLSRAISNISLSQSINIIETRHYSQERYRLLFERNLAGVFITSPEGQIVDCNDSFARFLGYEKREHIMDVKAEDLFVNPMDRKRFLAKLIEEGTLSNVEVCFLTKQGKEVWGLANVHVNQDPGGENQLIEGTVIDITERIHSEVALRRSLDEKEALLKEVHHRVKNNLQVISSILNLQSGYVKDPLTKDMLKESQNRVRSMAWIHESLYRTEDVSSVAFDKYLEKLGQNLFLSYRMDNQLVELRFNTENVQLDLDRAIPCALMINELVSNSLKYAFPEGRKGEIELSLKARGTQIELTVRDNGIGLPESIDITATDSLGLQLVSTLADQINGTLTLTRKDGTTFTLVFEIPSNKPDLL